MNEVFRQFSTAAPRWVGSPVAFTFSLVAIVAWAASGPMFGYSDVTFLMVFLIQNTQNRDARAIHLKLDELIRGLQGARNHLVDLENMTDAELDNLQGEFQRLRARTEPRSIDAQSP